MQYVVLLLLTGCFHHVRALHSEDWLSDHEKIRILDARKIKNQFTRGELVLHDDSDYEFRDSLLMKEHENIRRIEQGFPSGLDETIEKAAEDLMLLISNGFAQGNVTLAGEMKNRHENPKYAYYSLHKSCGDKIPIERDVEQYMGDESNQVNIWVVNEMKTEMDVSFSALKEKSSSTVDVKTMQTSTSLSTTFGVSAFGQSASYTASMSFDRNQSFKKSNANIEKNGITYTSKVAPDKAIKFMRYMKMQRVKLRFEIHCSLQGYIGFQLNAPWNGQARWFMPVTELAKVYDKFVLDETQPNSVIFKFPGYEVSSESIHIMNTLGMKAKDLGSDFLALM